jgi:hypothetical protein
MRSPPAACATLAMRSFATAAHLGGVMRMRGGAEEVTQLRTTSFEATWRRLSAGTLQDEPIARSSHEISLVGGSVLLFGGEHEARVPIDANLWAFQLKDGREWKWERLAARGEIPAPRIGHAQAAIDTRLYVMGGRQGIAMDEAPLDDLFCFDTMTSTWERIKPAPSSAPPPTPRSFHRMVFALLFVVDMFPMW